MTPFTISVTPLDFWIRAIAMGPIILFMLCFVAVNISKALSIVLHLIVTIIRIEIERTKIERYAKKVLPDELYRQFKEETKAIRRNGHL